MGKNRPANGREEERRPARVAGPRRGGVSAQVRQVIPVKHGYHCLYRRNVNPPGPDSGMNYAETGYERYAGTPVTG